MTHGSQAYQQAVQICASRAGFECHSMWCCSHDRTTASPCARSGQCQDCECSQGVCGCVAWHSTHSCKSRVEGRRETLEGTISAGAYDKHQNPGCRTIATGLVILPYLLPSVPLFAAACTASHAQQPATISHTTHCKPTPPLAPCTSLLLHCSQPLLPAAVTQ